MLTEKGSEVTGEQWSIDDGFISIPILEELSPRIVFLDWLVRRQNTTSPWKIISKNGGWRGLLKIQCDGNYAKLAMKRYNCLPHCAIPLPIIFQISITEHFTGEVLINRCFTEGRVIFALEFAGVRKLIYHYK